jgi:tripartite-type tricarboxylate transporter receptor subunit TctC
MASRRREETMQRPRRTFLRLAASALALPAVTRFAWAQTYPDKPIRILVGFAPAGPADIAARVLGDKLTEAWGKPVVIENVTGAAGNVSAERASKAAPDGYTLLLGASSTISTNISLYEKLGFDPVRDFVPISQLCVTPNILALNNNVPAKSVSELVALAKAQPGALTFGSAGVGTSQHLAGELFKVRAGVKLQHVPYRGIAQVVPDLLGGRLTMVFGNISALLQLSRENKVRALAVTSLKRAPSLPDIPAMAEQGFPGFDATAWFGLLAPTGTPAPIVARLHAETVKILAMPDVRRKFADLGMEPIGNSPAQFADVIKAEIPAWAKVIKESGAKAE